MNDILNRHKDKIIEMSSFMLGNVSMYTICSLLKNNSPIVEKICLAHGYTSSRQVDAPGYYIYINKNHKYNYIGWLNRKRYYYNNGLVFHLKTINYDEEDPMLNYIVFMSGAIIQMERNGYCEKYPISEILPNWN